MTRLAFSNADEGVSADDLDLDGDVDLVVPGKNGHALYWYVNPGNETGDWTHRPIGESSHWLDRVAIGYVNLDGHLDVIVSEESSDWF